MKRILLMAGILLAVNSMNGQQLPQLKSYYHNYYTINPAATGSAGIWQLRSNFRGEWLRFPGSPVYEGLGLHGPIKRVGLGLFLFNDRLGISQNYGLQTSYAYHIPMDKLKLSLGLGLRFQRFKIHEEDIVVLDQDDPAIVGLNEKMLADISLGAFLQTKKAYLGLSVPQLAQIAGSETQELRFHLFLMGGLKHKFNENYSLEPSILIKNGGIKSTQADINAKLHLINEQLFFGLGLRAIGGTYISFMVGARVKERYSFAYGYDMSTAPFQKHTRGAHEVTIGFDFNWKHKVAEPEIDGSGGMNKEMKEKKVKEPKEKKVKAEKVKEEKQAKAPKAPKEKKSKKDKV